MVPVFKLDSNGELTVAIDAMLCPHIISDSNANPAYLLAPNQANAPSCFVGSSSIFIPEVSSLIADFTANILTRLETYGLFGNLSMWGLKLSCSLTTSISILDPATICAYAGTEEMVICTFRFMINDPLMQTVIWHDEEHSLSTLCNGSDSPQSGDSSFEPDEAYTSDEVDSPNQASHWLQALVSSPRKDRETFECAINAARAFEHDGLTKEDITLARSIEHVLRDVFLIRYATMRDLKTRLTIEQKRGREGRGCKEGWQPFPKLSTLSIRCLKRGCLVRHSWR
ncbi:hypothetical protein M885DRAFT_542228 [Pelagophyceae sp. CCMP2097]|nr:hypothetical protein M885DRAFT_542228 [Pelagophyceae sp. CCMP2097]